MQIVIEIDDDDYQFIQDTEFENYLVTKHLYEAVYEGKPLPKGHGRLIDISKIDEDRIDHDNPIIYLTMNGEYIEAVSLDYLNDLPTIIEADKEE